MKYINIVLFLCVMSVASYGTVGPITGGLAVCEGSQITLSDATSGGTWTTAAPGVATVDLLTGLVTGQSAGTARITYQLTPIDFTTAVVTVNPLPSPIGGILQTCTGMTTTLNSSPAGGTWTSGLPALASINAATGVASGILPGNTNITYTLPTGCKVTATLTVNETPFVFGSSIVCLGSPAVLNSTATGGLWTSSNPSKATVDPATGIVTGVALGTAVITMSLPTGCYGTKTMTVNPATTPITGATDICNGSTTLLADPTTGGTWSSSNTSVAIISTGGSVVALSPGTTTITYYITATGCYTTRTETINGALPISGVSTLCDGLTATYANATPGGTWSSSNPIIATVGSSSGIVTGIAPGTAYISYTVPCGSVVKMITITSTTPPISGVPSVCIGQTTLLGNGAIGGTWSTSAPTTAAVNSSTGLVTGVNPGTATIYYTTGSCGTVNVVITVNGLPGDIGGPSGVCAGSTITLTDLVAGGSWTSLNTAIATIGSSSGVVTGLTPAGATIVYTLPTGCKKSKTIVVNASAVIGGGSPAVCVGGFSVFTAIGGTGTWASSNPARATINSSGVITGISLGTATISYTITSSGCVTTQVVTVSSLCSGAPVAGSAHASAATVCSGNSVTLSLTGAVLACGISLQWQYSTDGASWNNLTGATTPTYVITPTESRYYRCRLMCSSSGFVSYSAPVLVLTNYMIATHTETNSPSSSCGPVDFYVSACGVSSTFSVVTYFGDASSVTTPLSPFGISSAHIPHSYSLPGTYTVKHVLYNAGVAVDSVTFTYEYFFCKTLSVQFYNDANSNCLFDAGDTYNVNPIRVEVDSNGIAIDTITITSALNRKVYGPVGTVYGFRFIAGAGGMSVACPSTGILYDTITSLVNAYPPKYFGLSCLGMPGYDLGITSSLVCDPTSAHGNITVYNSYCTSATPVVTMTFSPDYVFTSALPAPTSVSGTTITWNLPPVSAFSSKNITVYLSRLSSLPPLTVGDTINSTISVAPTIADVNTSNNVVTTIDTVRTSYGANDMAVFPAGHILPCTELQYRVRFQNTGYDTSHNISIYDTLAAELDPSSLNMVSASAPVKLTVINDGVRNIARFDFPNINLLDSTHHGLSDGMVLFSIKVKSLLTDGTLITNHAGVIFDDYPVKLTNDVISTIGIGAIAGPASVCTGLNTVLWDETPGGLWSTAASTATVAGGTVSGITPGTANITYTVTNACTSRTTTRVIDINPSVVPSIGISASTPDTICSGTSTIFTAMPVNAGMSATFEWKVNGASLGTGAMFVYAPEDSDLISVTVATDTACAAPDTLSDTLMMTVITTGPPSVTASVSPSDTVCEGTGATFTATPVLGGDLPTIIWEVNGVPVDTADSYFYVPANGDVVYCKMASTFACRSYDTATSLTITMTADAPYIPLITISASPGLVIAAGQYDTLTATVVGGGSSPTYQWMVDGVDVPGAVSPVFIANTFTDYDSITCKVTGSGACAITTFESVFLTIVSDGVTDASKGMRLSIFPNPNNGTFKIKGFAGTMKDEEVTLEITDMLGQVIFSRNTMAKAGKIDETVTVSNTLANGMYMLNLRTQGETRSFHFIMEQ